MRRFLMGGVVLAAIFNSSGAMADESFEAGRYEYMTACAACHGEKADGQGPFASYLTNGAPALTGLAAAHDGVFPLLEIFMIVDGRSGLRGHGGAMPIWGDRYRQDLGDRAGPYGAETLVRARILELVFYLQSIQATPPNKS